MSEIHYHLKSLMPELFKVLRKGMATLQNNKNPNFLKNFTFFWEGIGLKCRNGLIQTNKIKPRRKMISYCSNIFCCEVVALDRKEPLHQSVCSETAGAADWTDTPLWKRVCSVVHYILHLTKHSFKCLKENWNNYHLHTFMELTYQQTTRKGFDSISSSVLCEFIHLFMNSFI